MDILIISIDQYILTPPLPPTSTRIGGGEGGSVLKKIFNFLINIDTSTETEIL